MVLSTVLTADTRLLAGVVKVDREPIVFTPLTKTPSYTSLIDSTNVLEFDVFKLFMVPICPVK